MMFLPVIPAHLISFMALVSAILMLYKWRDNHWTPFVFWFLWKILPQLYLFALYAFVAAHNIQPEMLSSYARFGLLLMLLPRNAEGAFLAAVRIKKWITGL